MSLLEERLAKLWMTGYRKSISIEGSPRPSWSHPQDVVGVIQSELTRVLPDTIVLDYLVRVGWIHDILEDGYTSEGVLVTEEDLRIHKVNPQIIRDVVTISRSPGESKDVYLSRLIHSSVEVRLLKCIDRACNLRESPKRGLTWWDTYSASTRKFVIPLAESLRSEGWDTWALNILEHALTLRPSQRFPRAPSSPLMPIAR